MMSSLVGGRLRGNGFHPTRRFFTGNPFLGGFPSIKGFLFQRPLGLGRLVNGVKYPPYPRPETLGHGQPLQLSPVDFGAARQ